MNRNSVLLFLFFLICLKLNAQTNELVWKNIEVKQFYSQSANNTFTVYIKLPDNYQDTNKTYPVLYLLDGDISFPLALSTLQYLEYGQHIPEMIVVAVGYGSLDWRTGNNRSHDYTIKSTPDRPYQGGAANFLSFLGNELIPGIDLNYRVVNNERILMGHSLGGQFVLYAMLKDKDLFSDYIASSPHIPAVKELLIGMMEENAKHLRSSGFKLFISVGGKESRLNYLIPINEFVKKLMVIAGNKERITYRVFENEDHFTVPARALISGLISTRQ